MTLVKHWSNKIELNILKVHCAGDQIVPYRDVIGSPSEYLLNHIRETLFRIRSCLYIHHRNLNTWNLNVPFTNIENISFRSLLLVLGDLHGNACRLFIQPEWLTHGSLKKVAHPRKGLPLQYANEPRA